MIEIRFLSLSTLTEEEKKAVSPLMQSARRPCEETKSGKIASLFAFKNDRPIGTLIAAYFPDIRQGLIRHFYVLPEERQQGVGTQLMVKLLEHLKTQKTKYLEINFNAASPTSPDLESILKKSGWRPPKILTKRYFFDLHIFNPPWLNHPPKLKTDEEIFLLKDRTPEEDQLLRRWDRENPLIHILSPFESNYELEPLNSLGLRYKGELIGWIATHRVEPDIIRYSSIYIHSEHRGSGSAIALLAASIAIHKKKEPDIQGLTEINQTTAPLYWKRFVEKRLAIESVKLEEIKISHIFDF